MSVRHDAVRPDGSLDALVARYGRRVAPVAERVAADAAHSVPRAGSASGESAFGDLVADAQRSAAGADIAFVHSEGLRADIGAGPVTYGELFAAQPFGDDVVRMDLSGRAVGRLLEQQYRPDGPDHILQVGGLRYTLDPSRPEGRRVTGATLQDGTPLEPEQTYTVATDAFLASGGDGFSAFEEGEDRRVVGRDVELLVSYLEKLPRPFVAPDPARERRISPAALPEATSRGSTLSAGRFFSRWLWVAVARRLEDPIPEVRLVLED